MKLTRRRSGRRDNLSISIRATVTHCLQTLTQAQIQIRELDLNDAIFGFDTGMPANAFSIEREVYGQSFIVGTKLAF